MSVVADGHVNPVFYKHTQGVCSHILSHTELLLHVWTKNVILNSVLHPDIHLLVHNISSLYSQSQKKNFSKNIHCSTIEQHLLLCHLLIYTDMLFNHLPVAIHDFALQPAMAENHRCDGTIACQERAGVAHMHAKWSTDERSCGLFSYIVAPLA